MNTENTQKLEESLTAICLSETTHGMEDTSGILEFSNGMQAYAKEDQIFIWLPGKAKIHIFDKLDLGQGRIKDITFGEDTKNTIDFEGLHSLVDYSEAASKEIYDFQNLLNLPESKSSLSYNLDSNSIEYQVESACSVSLTLGFTLGHLVKEFKDTSLSMAYHYKHIGKIATGDSSSEVALRLLYRKLFKTFIQPIIEQGRKLESLQSPSCVISAE